MPVAVIDLSCFFGPPQASRAESPLSSPVLRVSEGLRGVAAEGRVPTRKLERAINPGHSTGIISVGPPVPPINPPTPIAEVGP